MSNRLQVTSASAGTPIHFTFEVNPYIYNPSDEAKTAQVDILQGAPVYQLPLFDNSQRIMEWSGILVDNSYLSATMTYFRSIEGEIRYFNFNDLESMNTRWPDAAVSASTATWKKARIITMKATYRPGGRLKYDKVSLILQPEL